MEKIPRTAAEINGYLEAIGPGRGRPPRPEACPFCGLRRVWFDGWRLVFAVLLVDGAPVRCNDGLWLQRVKCATCRVGWTLRPRFLWPRLTFELDVVEVAVLLYLAGAETYRSVALAYGCAHASVWRWVGRVERVALPAEVVAATARIAPATPAPFLIPWRVPGVERKARSTKRSAVLLHALQLLAALTFWARVQLFPPDDPSPLRLWVHARVPGAYSPGPPRGAIFSPAMEHEETGPPE